VTRYNAIYGSFAALPLFLVWLQISWLIVLFGAVVSYAHQNQEAFELAPDSGRISHHLRTLLTLRVVHFLVKGFTEGERPVTAPQMALALDLPHHLLHHILRDLVATGIISPVCPGPNEEPGYQPARDSDMITIEFVTTEMESLGTADLPREKTPTERRLQGSLETFQDLIRKSSANLKLKDL
jgi:membrane protein